jgi:large subunit ribosomal protein L15
MSMIHEITGTVPRNKRRQRKGRGESSGRGKTSGRGNKGSGARVGTYIKRGYEGGQTPIFRRFPKRGFSNFEFAKHFNIINLADLDVFDNGATVDAESLADKGLIRKNANPVKILGNGEISKKLTVVAAQYSKSAFEKITKAGGVANNLKGETFQFPREKKKFVPREPVKKKKGGEEAPAEAAPAAEAKKPE